MVRWGVMRRAISFLVALFLMVDAVWMLWWLTGALSVWTTPIVAIPTVFLLLAGIALAWENICSWRGRRQPEKR